MRVGFGHETGNEDYKFEGQGRSYGAGQVKAHHGGALRKAQNSIERTQSGFCVGDRFDAGLESGTDFRLLEGVEGRDFPLGRKPPASFLGFLPRVIAALAGRGRNDQRSVDEDKLSPLADGLPEGA